MNPKSIYRLASIAAAIVLASNASASLVDFAATPDAVVGGGMYADSQSGFRIDWTISQNMDGTWHYRYDFTDAAQNVLMPTVSHIILELSDNIQESDLFNYGNSNPEFGTFGEGSGTPGFPGGGSIFGVKLDLTQANLSYVEFDSTRQPHWADFYVKGGDSDFAYNTDFGTTVSNPNDFNAPTALDENGFAISKILAPNSIVPAPSALAILVAGGLAGRRRRRSG